MKCSFYSKSLHTDDKTKETVELRNCDFSHNENVLQFTISKMSCAICVLMTFC